MTIRKAVKGALAAALVAMSFAGHAAVPAAVRRRSG